MAILVCDGLAQAAVVRGLFAWDRGERPVDLLFEVPPARRVLALQARGRRCVCLLDDAAARAHGWHAGGMIQTI